MIQQIEFTQLSNIRTVFKRTLVGFCFLFFAHTEDLFPKNVLHLKMSMVLIQKLIICVTWLKAYVTSEQENKNSQKKIWRIKL